MPDLPHLYEVTCAELLYPRTHRHIVGVGVLHPIDGRRQYERLTVEQVLARMAAGGHVFFTGTFGKDEAYVDKYTCSACGRDTLRTRGDQTVSNNLDQILECT